jgi:hypothetical protein
MTSQNPIVLQARNLLPRFLFATVSPPPGVALDLEMHHVDNTFTHFRP